MSGAGASGVVRFVAMNAVKARVHNGRLLVDEPTTLPDGCEVTLAVLDGDDLENDDRAALHEALDEAFADADAGRVVDEEHVRALLRNLG
jgi:hypothetical protein